MQRFNINREIELPAKLDVYGEIDEIMPWRSKAACLGVAGEILFPAITGRYADRMREESLEDVGIWAGRFLT